MTPEIISMNPKTTNKVFLLGSLYIAQGVPFGFFTQAFPVLMRTQGYSLAAIGLTTLLAIPWAAKFLWAPAVDRYWFSKFGRRKSWLVPLQFATTVSLLTLAFLPTGAPSILLMGAVFTVNFMIASQDIAADALAVDIINDRERGMANGVQVAGYRLGMVVGGGLLLIVYDRLGWSATFISMAGIVMFTTIPVLLHREAPHLQRIGERDNISILSFLRRPGISHAIVLIAVYKFGEGFASGMVRPFLIDQGVDITDIATMLGVIGFGAILAGGLIGGALINKLGRRNALAGFATLQACTIAGYAYLSIVPTGRVGIYIICAAESFTSGLANAALFTCMMDWSNKQTGATDYTVQASIVVIAAGIAATISGFSAASFGYTMHFMLSSALAAASIVTVFLFYKRTPRKLIFGSNVPSQETCYVDRKTA